LERHGHLAVTDEVRTLLLAVSPATADRLLRPIRQPHGLSTTRPGRLLKHQIPIRTFADWDDVRPGFLEADLVAHCGGNPAGAFLYTLSLTDVATAWTECLPLFPRLGIDTDNGGELLNAELLAYCTREQVTFTDNATAWMRTAESGNALTFHFCPTCGSTVYWENEGFPGYVAVAIGNFADPNFLAPTIAVWEESRHSWFSLPPNMPPKRVAEQG
jgi:hypothetical protein